MLMTRVLTVQAPVTFIAVEVVRWGAQVLFESLLAVEAFVTLVAFEVMRWGAQVLLESSGIAEVAIARNAALCHLW